MSTYTLDVCYPEEKMQKSAHIMKARELKQYADRVPVNLCVVARFFTPLQGVGYNEIYKDV